MFSNVANDAASMPTNVGWIGVRVILIIEVS